MSFYRDQLEAYLSKLDIKADRVLDVGGASNPVKSRVKSWEVKEYDILDNGLEEGKSDIKYDLNKDIIKHWEDTGIQQHDIVFCLEVMEYIYDPMIAIKNLHWLTKKGGTLYITFPTLYPVHNPYNNDYLRYTKFGAIKLLEEAGFKIEEIVPRTMKAPDIYNTSCIAEGYKTRGASSSGTLFDAGYIIKCTKL